MVDHPLNVAFTREILRKSYRYNRKMTKSKK